MSSPTPASTSRRCWNAVASTRRPADGVTGDEHRRDYASTRLIRPPGPRALWPGAVGAVLGAASFAADLAAGTLREVLQFVASTGFAWGCAAFAVAAFAETRRGAAGAAVVAGIAVATWAFARRRGARAWP